MATVRIGISGWRYAPWRGVFYPAGLPQRAELAYAARTFSSIELNGSFYSLQRPESFASWHDATPPEFIFAVKGPRFITHMKKLREPEEALANFLASGLFKLRSKLGPILWQFPAQFRYDHDRLASFLEILPRDTESALRLARRRNRTLMQGRTCLAIDEKRPLRHAIEIRSETFLTSGFVELLRQHNVALVIAETAKRYPMPEDVTADFMYLRLHGDTELYRSGYEPPALERWAERIRTWQRGDEPRDASRIAAGRAPHSPRDVYCYFDNTDVKLRAPFDARQLAGMLASGRGAASSAAAADAPAGRVH